MKPIFTKDVPLPENASQLLAYSIDHDEFFLCSVRDGIMLHDNNSCYYIGIEHVTSYQYLDSNDWIDD